MALTSESPFVQFFDPVGDGTGDRDAAKDFSSVAVKFLIKPAADQVFQLGTLRIMIRDNSIVNQRYGNIIGGVTNGWTLKFKNDAGADIPIFGPGPIRSNLDFSLNAYNIQISDNGGNDAVLIASLLTVTTADVLVTLDGSAGDLLEIELSDDYSSLSAHRFRVGGFIDI